MSDRSDIFQQLLGDEKQLAFDRASAELRDGRPIVVDVAAASMIIAALDGVSPRGFSIFAATGNGMLALSAQRGRILGLAVDQAIEIPLTGLDLDLATDLATAPRALPPTEWRVAGKAANGAIELCKQALLLPAALTAPIGPGLDIPPSIHRITLDQIARPAPGRQYNLEIVSEAEVPLAGGIRTRFLVFRGGPAPRDQVAVIVGAPDKTKSVPVRVHSACLTGDLFGSLRCDCGDQLRNAVAQLEADGGGVLLYLDQEGRGIGIGNKMRSYALQDEGFDTIDADAVLGFDADERRYEYAAAILAKLGYRRIRLLTNNPRKIDALTRAGIEVTARQPLMGAVTAENLHYLYTKARRADHMLEELLDLAEPAAGVGE